MPFTYILRCADGSYYVGSTKNLERRLAQHDAGEGAVYTSSRRPVELVWAHEFQLVDNAFAFEKRVQGWSRAKREALIDGRFDDLPALSRSSFRRLGLAPHRPERAAWAQPPAAATRPPK